MQRSAIRESRGYRASDSSTRMEPSSERIRTVSSPSASARILWTRAVS